MTIEIDDERMTDLIAPDAAVERLATGGVWTEGPVYLPSGHPQADPTGGDDDCVLYSDIPNDRICRWSARDGWSVWRADAEFTNGHTLDLEGRIVSCSHGHRRVERTEPDGSVTALVTRWGDRRFNSPNDVVVRSDGTIWFTDPPYGIISDREGHAAPSEIGVNLVFRLDPATGALTALTEAWTDRLIDPNGLAFSPDETVLYVSDTSAARIGDEGRHRIMAFDIVEAEADGEVDGEVDGGPHLANPRVVTDVTPGVPDGFRVTSRGWIVTSAADGVHVVDADGTRLGRIPVPEVVSNCCFGGPDGLTLYITATSSLYRVPLRSN